MEQIEIWDFELAINNLLFDKDKKDDGLVVLTTMCLSNKEVFNDLIDELIAIKEASNKLQENSSKKEILNAIKEVKQKIKERMEMSKFENRIKNGPLALKEDDKKIPNRMIKNRDLEMERERERRRGREIDNLPREKNRPSIDKGNRIPLMYKNEENHPFLNKQNLQIEYGPIKTYSDFNELDKDMVQMFCYVDKRPDVAFNIFILVNEMDNGRFEFIDIADRYKTNDNSKFLGKEYIEIKKTLSLSKMETIKTDKVFFSLNDKFHNSPNAFRRCLKIIAEHISNERLGIFKERSELKYIVVHTQENRLTLYRLIASMNDMSR